VESGDERESLALAAAGCGGDFEQSSGADAPERAHWRVCSGGFGMTLIE
jgi:hypothetical protein